MKLSRSVFWGVVSFATGAAIAACVSVAPSETVGESSQAVTGTCDAGDGDAGDAGPACLYYTIKCANGGCQGGGACVECAPGYLLVGVKCESCASLGYFTNSSGACEACPTGAALSCNACVCPYGEFWQSSTNTCLPCADEGYMINSAGVCVACPPGESLIDQFTCGIPTPAKGSAPPAPPPPAPKPCATAACCTSHCGVWYNGKCSLL